MATTAVIAEILVIGMFGAVWVLLLVFRVAGPDALHSKEVLSFCSSMPVLATFAVGAVLYQLGWYVNWLSNLLATRLIRRRYINRIFKRDASSYSLLRCRVMDCGSPDILGEIRVDHSVIRLARAGVVNFGLTGFVLLAFRPLPAGAAGVAFGMMAVSFLLARYRYRLYYTRIYDAALTLDDKGKL